MVQAKDDRIVLILDTSGSMSLTHSTNNVSKYVYTILIVTQ